MPKLSVHPIQKADSGIRLGVNLLGTHRMRLAFELLSAPQAQLQQIVSNAIEENPLLELHEDQEKASGRGLDSDDPKELNFDEGSFENLENLGEDFHDILWQESSFVDMASEEASSDRHNAWLQQLPHHVSFNESISQQLFDVCEDVQLRHHALSLAGLVNDHGFLEISLKQAEEILKIPIQLLIQAQALLQSLSPKGLGSQDLRHSLLYQLKVRNLENSPAYLAVKSHWDDLLHGRIYKLGRHFHLVPGSVEKEILLPLQSLQRSWSKSDLSERIDESIDLNFEWSDKGWHITLNYPLCEQVSINRSYVEALKSEGASSKAYLKSKLAECKWLLQSLHEREKNILLVAHEIGKRQGAYLRVEGPLEPMHLKELAHSCHLHESTVARAIQNKIASTPRGLIQLRDLLNYGIKQQLGEVTSTSISSNAITEKIRDWIALEEARTPLSDEQIKKRLEDEGIFCARRTIAKYRASLGISSSDKRRRYA